MGVRSDCMKIVIAPDSFKESLTAMEASEAIEKGFRRILPDAEIVKVPMADGGEGIVQSLIDATEGKILKKRVTGPLGTLVEGFFGILGDGRTAVIEMAAASGLHLVPVEKRNPLLTCTKGTGELILAALDEGVDHIIIGIGGSATNDGGAGMARALGAKFFDEAGNEIAEGGGNLHKLASIDVSGIDRRLGNLKIEVACDVDSPLIGPRGASAIFGPQKGATRQMVQQLDQNLEHFAKILARDLGIQIANVPGAGAAGGLGGGLLAFLNAELKSGVDIVLEATKLNEIVKDATLVITGEGKIDSQTIFGKTPIGVAKTAKQYGVPVVAIAGNLADDCEVVYEHGIDALFCIVPGILSLPEAFEHAAENVEKVSANIASLLKIASQMKFRTLKLQNS
jgi:glycerate 2-kinase